MEKDYIPQTYPVQPLDSATGDTNNPVPQEIKPVDIFQIDGLIETVTIIPTHTPKNFEQQVKLYVDSITAPTVKTLYIYSNKTNTWLAFPLATGTVTATALAMNSIFDNYIDFLHWSSVDSFDTNTGGSGGSATPGDGALSMQTVNISNSEVYICSKTPYRKIYETAKQLIWEFHIVDFNYIGNTTAPIHMTASQAGPPSVTAHHFGWHIDGGTLYATNADGSTETKTDTTVTIGTGVQTTKLKIVATKGTNIKYYVNDVLKVTTTTNLPTTTDLYINLGVKTSTTVNVNMWLSRMLIQKEY